MRSCALAVGLLCTASLYGQSRRFNWQNYCFDHASSPVCPGHEYAVKPPTKGQAAKTAVNNPFPPAQRPLNPSVIVIGGDLDWRFADPAANGLIGLNFSALSGSPVARDLLTQLGIKHGVAEPDMRKILDGLTGASQIALSVTGNQVVAMVTGSVKDLSPTAREAGLKAAPVSRNAMLIGHADLVDQAFQRISIKGALPDVTKLADGLQAGSEFWAAGSAALAGPEAANAGVRQFSVAVSFRDKITSDISMEFEGPPNMEVLQSWQGILGGAAVEGNRLHFRMFLEPDAAQQKLAQAAGIPIGQRVSDLFEMAKYLPARDTTARKTTGPMIYGLDGGPKEVNQLPAR